MQDILTSGQVERPIQSPATTSPDTTSPVIGAAELGALLMPSVRDPARWIANHHQRLTESDGLPRKLPGGWVWSRPSVMNWMETYGAPRQVRIAAGGNVVDLQRKRVLEQFGRRT